jgi:hypothetical protein
MRMLDRRLQILLDEGRYQKLSSRARRQHTSIAAVIRDAIDALDDETRRRDAAVEAILAAPQIDLPADPADLRRELDEAHGRFV